MTTSMTSVPPAFRVPLPDPVVELLGKHIVELPDPELDLFDGHVRAEVADRYRAVLTGTPDAWAVVRHLRDLVDDDQGEGFAVLTAVPLLDHYGFDDGLKAMTVVLSWLATPLKADDGVSLWKPLSVGPEQVTGARPLHVDMIHTTRPPDYTAFLCTRPDPRGGGLSLVSPVRRAVFRLSDDERRLLTDHVYGLRDAGAMTGVGPVLDAFPVLDDSLPPTDGFVRFDPQMLKDADRGDPHTSAARALERELIAAQRRFRLGLGDLLVTNQHLCAHGHGALGGFQSDIPEDQRRRMRQIHLRTHEPAS
ncbi:TauD/TfdA family dioxygenase [Streptomyces sp. NPDC004539]|uniref:TauD/TfdA family dioxygenase n=1 Tax=Streptomyces sp. NPDC004539 TaxID=3154280 RepID=UPI0033B85752